MKKNHIFMICTLVAGIMLFGCQKKEAEVVQETPSQIVWAGWSGNEESSRDIFNKMRAQYQESSGIPVSWVGWTWAETAQQLLIRLQGGEQLDIAQVDIGIFNTIANTGTLADLTEVFGKEYLTSTFEQSALDVGKFEGKQLALPWSMASISLVYNPEILKKAGWDTVPTTVAEFEKCLADIKAMDPSIVPYGVSTKSATAAGDLMPWLWTFGSSIFNADGSVNLDQNAVKTVKWYQNLLASGYIKMDIGRGEARQLFAQGKMAFYDDAVVAKGQAVNNGVAPEDVVKVCSAMPRPVLTAGDQPQSTMWGHMLVIFDSSKYKDTAADFAKSLVSDNIALEYFQKNGMPPVTKSAASSSVVKQDSYLRGFLESTSTAKLDETAWKPNANEIKSIVTEELQAALLGQKTAETAVSDMKTRINSL